ncbi:MAG: hypothetical protein ONB44_00335 [candidate division KSB1 bacterium]|nr:hypothetical protein [candidate division KSB1 bacterium]MDZ7300568.1 hypothetical protein [candidate division KSB1 bacterium]MDZ7309705.1 hypothetical protein [candidate division KSB1 bacterium]
MNKLKSCCTRAFPILAVVLCLGNSLKAWAQEYDTAAEIRWLRVGSLHNWFANAGSEVEYGRRGRACCQNTDQNDGLRWPAEFQFQDHQVSKALWIGTTNYNDPVSGKTYQHKVISAGPRFAALRTEFMPVEFKMIGRFSSPIVVVDGVTASDNALLDVLDDTQASLGPDRLLINKTHTSIGITVTRKIMAFSQQYHDNYFIYDYVFKNTGIIDLKGTKVEKTLTDVVFFFQYRYAFANEAYRNGWALGQGVSWGRNAVNQVVGRDPTAPGFEFRAHYAWYGPHSQAAEGYDADWGAPNYTVRHIMTAASYVGVVTIHADKSAQDKTDNPYQPFTTRFMGSDADAQQGSAATQYDATYMTTRYGYITAGHPAKTHADEVGSGFANLYGTDPGGYAQGQGFGPYTLAPGDSIHIVLAEAVAGISRSKNLEVMRNWRDATKTSFTLPNGATTTDRNLYKKAWVQTGVDSLFQSFRRAISNYKSNYNIPQPPPPPKQFTVTSGGDRIILSWSNEAESYPHFDGYRIFRAVDRPDTLYEEIFSCNRSNVVNSFSDTSPLRGRNYYYYIQSKDDGTTNDVARGVPLVSNKFYTMTNQPAFLRRPAAKSLDAIRVVPNPYHIRARDRQFGYDAPDRIAFFGLPPECTIKIYTERGDLIETIHHIDGSGDELWDSLTFSRQVVVSGLYIAYFEVTKDVYDQETNKLLFRKGDNTLRKFIIIR